MGSFRLFVDSGFYVEMRPDPLSLVSTVFPSHTTTTVILMLLYILAAFFLLCVIAWTAYTVIVYVRERFFSSPTLPDSANPDSEYYWNERHDHGLGYTDPRDESYGHDLAYSEECKYRDQQEADRQLDEQNASVILYDVAESLRQGTLLPIASDDLERIGSLLEDIREERDYWHSQYEEERALVLRLEKDVWEWKMKASELPF